MTNLILLLGKFSVFSRDELIVSVKTSFGTFVVVIICYYAAVYWLFVIYHRDHSIKNKDIDERYVHEERRYLKIEVGVSCK